MTLISSLELPIAVVVSTGTGAIRVDVTDDSQLYLRLGFSDGERMPNHWRSVAMTPEHARVIGDALIRYAETHKA